MLTGKELRGKAESAEETAAAYAQEWSVNPSAFVLHLYYTHVLLVRSYDDAARSIEEAEGYLEQIERLSKEKADAT